MSHPLRPGALRSKSAPTDLAAGVVIIVLMGPCAVRPVARSRRAIWLTILFIAGTVVQASAQTESAEALRRRSLQLVYEHQHDEAIALLRKAVALAPDEPAMHRTLALAIWLKMLFLRGAVTVDHYLGSFSRPRVDLRKPPPELVSRVRRRSPAGDRSRGEAERRAPERRAGPLRPRRRGRAAGVLHRVDRGQAARRVSAPRAAPTPSTRKCSSWSRRARTPASPSVPIATSSRRSRCRCG